MKKYVLQFFINSAAFYAATLVFSAVRMDNFFACVLAGAVLTVINLFIRPFLILIALPLNFLTLGVFTLVINTWMLMLADLLVGGIHIPGFWTALAISLLISSVKLLLNCLNSHKACIP
ncbi:MAG: hypothetical protein VR68_02600 [Peptococcaceae bacterium BRH_c4a]|nr:MAG: hypothetical protein VR68_02600 [Peptococcaceae bacterium BRH_c4a]